MGLKDIPALVVALGRSRMHSAGEGAGSPFLVGERRGRERVGFYLFQPGAPGPALFVDEVVTAGDLAVGLGGDRGQQLGGHHAGFREVGQYGVGSGLVGKLNRVGGVQAAVSGVGNLRRVNLPLILEVGDAVIIAVGVFDPVEAPLKNSVWVLQTGAGLGTEGVADPSRVVTTQPADGEDSWYFEKCSSRLAP